MGHFFIKTNSIHFGLKQATITYTKSTVIIRFYPSIQKDLPQKRITNHSVWPSKLIFGYMKPCLVTLWPFQQCVWLAVRQYIVHNHSLMSVNYWLYILVSYMLFYYILDYILILDCDCSKNKNSCHHFGGICYMWPKESMSWYASRNWCHKKGGHLMNKSNIDQYVPHYSVTQRKYYWIGSRKADWTLYNNTGFSYASFIRTQITLISRFFVNCSRLYFNRTTR